LKHRGIEKFLIVLMNINREYIQPNESIRFEVNC